MTAVVIKLGINQVSTTAYVLASLNSMIYVVLFKIQATPVGICTDIEKVFLHI